MIGASGAGPPGAAFFGVEPAMAPIFWLNDQPLWASIMVLIGGAVALSIIGTAVSGLFFGEQQLSLNNIVGGFKYLFISSVYASFLGFLLYGVYNRYDKTRADVIEEVTELTTLDRLASAFPLATQRQLQNALKQYAREVVDVEWPQLRNRTARMTMTAALDTLDYTYGAVEPATRKQQEVLQYSRKILGDIRDRRGIRVLRSLGGLPILLWIVTLASTAVTIVFPWVFGSPNVNASILMSMLSTLLMTSVVLVVLKLSFPFSGAYGIRPTPYAAFIAELSAPPRR